MKQSMHYGNTHVFSATQQSGNTKRPLLQKHNSIKNWLRCMRAFVKESLEKNGDFFLNNHDF